MSAESELAAEWLRQMIIRTDGAAGIDLVDALEEEIDAAYERGYEKGRLDEAEMNR